MHHWQRWTSPIRTELLYNVPTMLYVLSEAPGILNKQYVVEAVGRLGILREIHIFPTYEEAAVFYYEKVLIWMAKRTGL